MTPRPPARRRGPPPSGQPGRSGRLAAAALLVAMLWPPAAGLAAPGATAGGPAPDPHGPLADCDRRLAAEPGSRDAASCFFAAAGGDPAAAAARLRAHLAADPASPWLHYYLGNVLWPTRDPGVADHYATAARLLGARGDRAGETDARLNLASYLRLLGRAEESAAALDGAVDAARASGDPMLAAKTEVERATQALGAGGDVAAVYRDLRRIERVAFPDGPYALRRDCLRALGTAASLLGRWEEARRTWGLYRELVAAQGDRYGEADATYNLAAAVLAAQPADATPGRAVALFGEALTIAEQSGNVYMAAASHRVLGRLLTGPEARRHLERCVEIAEDTRQTWMLPTCLGALAVVTADDDPAEARRLIDRSLALSLEAGSPWPLVYSWSDRMQTQWRILPREAALADSLDALEVIEAVRALQSGESGRVDLGAVWSEAYFWLAGRLLDSEPSRRELAVAFRLGERARARTLLETLETREAPPRGPSPEHRAVLEEIVAVHRRLLDDRLSDDDRRLALARLDELETDEAALREAAGIGAPGELAAHDFAELGEVESLLAPDEAMLVFQPGEWRGVYGEFDGGSWLLAVTAGGTRVHRIPARAELAGAVRILLGLIERRDGAERAAAAALGERLLGPALDALPEGIDRLVVVPDGPLHLLPFAALRPGEGRAPLASRYRLSHAPSATLWARWRRTPGPPPAPPTALVLADPAPARDGSLQARETAVPTPAAAVRDASLARGGGIGPLPDARREGRTIARRLGRHGDRTGQVELLVGEQASEARLKDGAPIPRAIHFAAHALVDGEHPGRSAVLLAPGAADQDGLLQPREIAALDLDDRLIVLSACRGAAGAVLRGEGAMSLARAFFQAGARTVVAALWPLRDDDTRELADRFYAHLAAGEAVDGALAAAQREMIADDYPAAAWAGLVVLGDGGWRPFEPAASNGMARRDGVLLAAAALAALAALGGLYWLAVIYRHRRDRQR